jgi:hypothetical protein
MPAATKGDEEEDGELVAIGGPDDTDYTERLARLWELELRVLGEIDGYGHTEL